MSGRAKHWDDVYGTRATDELSWFAEHLSDSLRVVRSVSTPESAVIDVGGGAATLLDDLLSEGYRDLTLLDISETALAGVRSRLGQRAEQVTFIAADVTAAQLPTRAYDVWHDRAAFHFLTEQASRRAYVASLRGALRPGGHAVLSTFSLQGPERCSGLSVVRYDAAGLQAELGDDFDLVDAEQTTHLTPSGKQQAFLLCCFKRVA